MSRKLVSLLLALAMLLSCGAVLAEDSTERVQSIDDNELMMWTSVASFLADSAQIMLDIEENEGVNLTWIASPSDQKEFINLKIASGEIPDILRDFDFPTYDSYVQQGVYAEVSVELIKEYAPNLAAWAEKYGGENIWKYYERDGKNYSVPIMWTLAADNRVLGIREDLFEAAGASIPTTIAEMDEALQLLHDKLDIAPLTATSLQSGLDWVFGAYGAYLNFFEGDDGELHYGWVEDGAKEALTVLADWYSRGLIDPEFYTNDDDAMQDKWDSGKAAICEHEWYYFVPQQCFYLGKFYETCMANNPDAKITIIDAPTGDGEHNGFALGNVVTSAGLQFGAHLDEEHIIKYLQFFDKYSFVQEYTDIVAYGYEGVTYTYDTENGVTWLDGFTTKEEREAYGVNCYYCLPGCFNDYDLQAKYMTQPQYLEMRNDAPTHSSGKMDIMSPVYRPIYNEKIENLNMIIRQGFIDIITGVRPVDDFDAIVSEWYANGGEEVMEESKAAFESLK